MLKLITDSESNEIPRRGRVSIGLFRKLGTLARVRQKVSVNCRLIISPVLLLVAYTRSRGTEVESKAAFLFLLRAAIGRVTVFRGSVSLRQFRRVRFD